jgi:hypothetical protein
MKNAIQSFKSKTTSTISENDVEEIEMVTSSSRNVNKSEEIELLNLSDEEEEYKPNKNKLINQPKTKKTAAKSRTTKKKK